MPRNKLRRMSATRRLRPNRRSANMLLQRTSPNSLRRITEHRALPQLRSPGHLAEVELGAKGAGGSNAGNHGGANKIGSGSGSGKITAANTNAGNNPQRAKNTNAPNGSGAGAAKGVGPGGKDSNPPKNPPPPKGKGGTGGRNPKEHQ